MKGEKETQEVELQQFLKKKQGFPIVIGISCFILKTCKIKLYNFQMFYCT